MKPENLILFGTDHLMLADFGIAKLLSDDSKLTATGGNTIVTINSTASLAGWDQTGRWATTNNGTLAMPNSFAEADIATALLNRVTSGSAGVIAAENLKDGAEKIVKAVKG